MTGTYDKFFNPDGTPKRLFARPPAAPPPEVPDLWQMMLNTTQKIPMRRMPSYDPPSVMENAPDLLDLLPTPSGPTTKYSDKDNKMPGLDAWMEDSGAGQLTKRAIDSWLGFKPLGKYANEYVWDPYQRFMTGRPSATPRGPEQGPPLPPEEPPAPSAAPTRSAPSSLLDMWKGLITGGSGGEAPIKLPEQKGYDWLTTPVPQQEAPTKPDYSEADKLFEESKPTGRKARDTTWALLAGLASGYNPRPGEGLGATLGRMAGPGLQAFVAANEKNDDIEAANAEALARWKMMRGESLGRRASETANIANEAANRRFQNMRDLRSDEKDRLLFGVGRDDKLFERAVSEAQLRNQERQASASELSAKAAMFRSLAGMGETSNTSSVYDLQDYVARIAAGKLAPPPGINLGEINTKVQAQLAAEAKANPTLYMQGNMAEKRAEQLRAEHFMNFFVSLPQEARDQLLATARKARRKEMPGYVGE